MGLSTGSLTNHLGEGGDIVLIAAFKASKRGAMSNVGEKNVHGERGALLEIRRFQGATLLPGTLRPPSHG